MGRLAGFQDGTMAEVEHGARKLRIHPLALKYWATRKALQVSPGFLPLTAEAEAALQSDTKDLLKGVAKALTLLKAQGKDHLCIVPDGPLHYYPFHLLSVGDKLLAEEWLVSYLPSVRLLFSSRDNSTPITEPSQSLACFGLDFAAPNRFGLDEIKGSLEEVRGVAAAFGAVPILNEQATVAALHNAFESSRYVHVSSHGDIPSHAPAFQCIYLHPDESSDGRLFAYQLLGKDLRHVRMVTLSACKTSQGRFDNSGNLWGLPASLFLSGIRIIVGTLWSVRAPVSAHFFQAMYRAIADGKSSLDAFAHAQRATKASFPKYRDWGAFYYAGDWRDTL